MTVNKTGELKPILPPIQPRKTGELTLPAKPQTGSLTDANVPVAKDAKALSEGVAWGIDEDVLERVVPEADDEYITFGGPTVRDRPTFEYEGVDLPSHEQIEAGKDYAPGRRPSGTENNALINEAYNELSNSFDDFLNPEGVEPRQPSWVTFGQYASREVGTQIRQLESAFEQLTDIGVAVVEGAQTLNPITKIQKIREIADALGDMLEITDGELVNSGLRAVFAQFGFENRGDIVQFFLNPLNAGKVPEIVGGIVQGVEDLHQALVNGNSNIFNNIGPAYDIFMQAEAQGEDGLAALEAAGYGGEPLDPQNFVIDAFAHYKQARELRLEAAALPEGDPRREALIAESTQLIERGNLLIGVQEQGVILQAPDIYGDPDVAKFVNSQAGTLKITDPNGDHALINGPWADFETRTGLREVEPGTPGAIRYTSHEGETKYYVPREPGEDGYQGTIVQYFHDSLEAEAAENILDGAPRPLEPLLT